MEASSAFSCDDGTAVFGSSFDRFQHRNSCDMAKHVNGRNVSRVAMVVIAAMSLFGVAAVVCGVVCLVHPRLMGRP